jgi:SPX domain protein involved in polyphosphate accumulation
MKTNGVSKKRRFWITHENRNQLILGKCLTFSDELQDLNEGLGKKKLNKRIREINWLVINYELVPQVRITYRRHAYERDGLRVTIDQNLKCDALSFVYPPVTKRLRKEEFWPRAFKMKDKFSNSTSVVVEIKHQRNIPAWFSHFMNENQVTQTSFSKYCWSMMHQIGYSLNKKYTVKVS